MNSEGLRGDPERFAALGLAEIQFEVLEESQRETPASVQENQRINLGMKPGIRLGIRQGILSRDQLEGPLDARGVLHPDA